MTSSCSMCWGTVLSLLRCSFCIRALSCMTCTSATEADAHHLLPDVLCAALKKFLKKNVVDEELAILDKKLGGIVQDKLGIPCIYRCGVLCTIPARPHCTGIPELQAQRHDTCSVVDKCCSWRPSMDHQNQLHGNTGLQLQRQYTCRGMGTEVLLMVSMHQRQQCPSWSTHSSRTHHG